MTGSASRAAVPTSSTDEDFCGEDGTSFLWKAICLVYVACAVAEVPLAVEGHGSKLVGRAVVRFARRTACKHFEMIWEGLHLLSCLDIDHVVVNSRLTPHRLVRALLRVDVVVYFVNERCPVVRPALPSA